MDLSINDLILKPETAGPGMSRPLAQRAGETASLAAFSDLLSQLSQVQCHTSDSIADVDLRSSQAKSERTDLEGTDRARADRIKPDARQEKTFKSDRTGECDGCREHKDSVSNSNDSPTPASEGPDDPSIEAGTIGARPDPQNSEEKAGVVSGTGSVSSGEPVQPAIGSSVVNAILVTGASDGGAPHAVAGTAANSAQGAILTSKAGATTNPGRELQHPGSLPANPADLPDASKSTAPEIATGGMMAKGSNMDTSATKKGPGTISNLSVIPATAPKSSSLSVAPDMPVEIVVETKITPPQPRVAIGVSVLASQEVSLHQDMPLLQNGPGNAANGVMLASGPDGTAMAANGNVGAGVPNPGAGPLPSPAEFTAANALTESQGTPASPTAAAGAAPESPALGATSPLHSAQGTAGKIAASIRAPQPAPLPADQLAVHIARAAAAAGTEHISIKLKPASLGQVDVKLEVHHDGRVTAVVTAHNANTLDLLQRDARVLERSLQDAGLKMDSNSLQFNLHGEAGSGHQFGQGHGAEDGVRVPYQNDEPDTAVFPMIAGYQNSRAGLGGIDISV